MKHILLAGILLLTSSAFGQPRRPKIYRAKPMKVQKYRTPKPVRIRTEKNTEKGIL